MKKVPTYKFERDQRQHPGMTLVELITFLEYEEDDDAEILMHQICIISVEVPDDVECKLYDFK